MKKTLILLAGIALIAVSCTKTEVVADRDSASLKGIGFSAYTFKPTKTAQVDVTNDNLGTFKASAFGNGAMYFDAVDFTKDTKDKVWESTPVYFWPAYPLTFCAYNQPAKGDFSATITKDSQTFTFSPSATLAEQEDIVAAYAANKTESNATSTESSLPLTFNHCLTQVVVKALCTNANYTVKVDEVKIANLAGEGTYKFSTEVMEANASMKNNAYSTDYSSSFKAKTLDSDPKEVMTDAGTGRWYLVPQTVTPWAQATDMENTANGTYLALKINITHKDGLQIYPASPAGETAWMAVPVTSQLAFVQGKKYNVTVKFFGKDGNGGAGYVDPEDPGELDGDNLTDDSGKKIIGGAIKFNADVKGWDTVDWNTVNVDILL